MGTAAAPIGDGIWDAATGEMLAELRGHTGVGVSAKFSPDGARVLTTGQDGTTRLWDTEVGAELLALPGGFFAEFSPGGSQIVTRGRESTAIIYDNRPVNLVFKK